MAHDPRTLHPFAIEAALTLLEAAALHSGPPSPGVRSVIRVTGPCSWLMADSWVIPAMAAAMRGAPDIAADPAIQAAGCMRRKVIAVALLRQGARACSWATASVSACRGRPLCLLC